MIWFIICLVIASVAGWAASKFVFWVMSEMGYWD